MYVNESMKKWKNECILKEMASEISRAPPKLYVGWPFESSRDFSIISSIEATRSEKISKSSLIRQEVKPIKASLEPSALASPTALPRFDIRCSETATLIIWQAARSQYSH